MPQVEAAACGIPIAAVNYSAMSDIVKKTNGIPIPVKRMFYEWETNAYRAYPDNDAAADSFYKFLNQNIEYRKTKGKQAKDAANKWFSWDKTAKIWSDHFESVILTGNQGKWDISPTIQDFNIPEYSDFPQLTNTQYVEWLCTSVAKDQSLFISYFGLSAIEQLNTGMTSTFKGGSPVDRRRMYEMFKIIGSNKVVCEKARVNIGQLSSLDFIEFAHEFERNIKHE